MRLLRSGHVYFLIVIPSILALNQVSTAPFLLCGLSANQAIFSRKNQGFCFRPLFVLRLHRLGRLNRSACSCPRDKA